MKLRRMVNSLNTIFHRLVTANDTHHRIVTATLPRMVRSMNGTLQWMVTSPNVIYITKCYHFEYHRPQFIESSNATLIEQSLLQMVHFIVQRLIQKLHFTGKWHLRMLHFMEQYTPISYLTVQQSKLSPLGAANDPMHCYSLTFRLL